MCGIVGYVGPKKVVPVIIEGLRRLEYRGYDSAGIAVGSPSCSTLEVRRAPGKLRNLEEVLREHRSMAPTALATPLATHGRPTEENAHRIGIARAASSWCTTNCRKLSRAEARTHRAGPQIVTETDTEVIAH